MNDSSVIFDPLYGKCQLEEITIDLLRQPELQRLRNIRLSNINSISFPGISNVSRFEHTMGVAYLAQIVAINLKLSIQDRLTLITAAVLHDIIIPAFGHLMEEGFRYAGMHFDHESRLAQIMNSDRDFGGIYAQVFKNKPLGFPGVLGSRKYSNANISWPRIRATLRGEGAFGQLINGTVDLDNIDNVTRMSYHLGLRFSTDLPAKMAIAFRFFSDKLCFVAQEIEQIESWLRLRQNLYTMLMTNPLDFRAKAMMVEAVRLAVHGTDAKPACLTESEWRLTDEQLLHRLQVYPPTRELVDNIVRGRLDDDLYYYWIESDRLSQLDRVPSGFFEFRKLLSSKLGCSHSDVIVYSIRDKRHRRIDNILLYDIRNSEKSTTYSTGHNSNLVLFGIVLKKNVSRTKAKSTCEDFIRSELAPISMVECSFEKELASVLDQDSQIIIPTFER